MSGLPSWYQCDSPLPFRTVFNTKKKHLTRCWKHYDDAPMILPPTWYRCLTQTSICLWGSSVPSLLPPAGQQFELICDMERYPSGSGHQMMEHCAHEEMDGDKTGWSLAQRECQRTGCAQKISSTLTASTVVTGQRGAVPSCCLHQTPSSHTNVAPEIALPIFHCPIFSEPVWMAASVCCSEPTESSTQCLLLLLWFARFKVGDLNCNQWLF